MENESEDEESNELESEPATAEPQPATTQQEQQKQQAKEDFAAARKPHEDQILLLELEKQKALSDYHASANINGQRVVPLSQQRVAKNQIEKTYTTKIDEQKRALNTIYQQEGLANLDVPEPFKQAAVKEVNRNNSKFTYAEIAQRKYESFQADSESKRQSSIQNAKSAAIKAREDSAVDLFESSKEKSETRQAKQGQDIANVNASLSTIGLTSDNLTKSGDLGITFRAAPKPETPKEQTTQQKSEQILQNVQNYKDDITPYTQPNASNFIPIDVPEPNKQTPLSTTYRNWNATHAATQQEQQQKSKETITKERSEQILNQYFLYKAGFTDLTEDVASDGKPRTLPTPKKEDVQSERNASEFYKKWVDRYGDITKEDLETAGIFSNPDKLQRVKELNMQRQNMPEDPAALILKGSIDQITQINSNKAAKAQATQSESNDIQIVRDGLIVIKNERYAVVSTPKYTRLIVYPTENKDGYVQILTTSTVTTQGVSEYVYDYERPLSLDQLASLRSQKTKDVWQTSNYLTSLEATMPSEVDKKSNLYIQQNQSDVIKAESNPLNQGGVDEIINTKSGFAAGFLGHATELKVAVESSIELGKGGTDDEIQNRIRQIEQKNNYQPTLESSVITDIMDRSKAILENKDPPKSHTKQFFELHQNDLSYVSGSLAGTIVAAAIPVGKITEILNPVIKSRTIKIADDIAAKTVPDGVAYSVEPVKGDPHRAVIWVGSEETTKQTIRTQPTENIVADVESGTGRATFDVIKINTKDKTAEFIRIGETQNKDKLISDIRMETRGTSTAKDLDLVKYDSQGLTEFSTGKTSFENIDKLFSLEKEQEVKQLATGEVRPLEDVKINPELYGDKPTYSTTENAELRFDQFTESLEGGKEPRIAGRVGYFVERPDGGKTATVEIPADILAKLEEPEPLGLIAKKAQQERNEQIMREYFTTRTYSETKQTDTRQSKQSKPFTYDDAIESEIKKLSDNPTDNKTKVLSDTEKKNAMSDLKNLLGKESKSTQRSDYVVIPASEIIQNTRLNTGQQSKTQIDTLEQLAFKTIQNSKLSLDTVQSQKQINITTGKQITSEDLEINSKLILDPEITFKQDIAHIPRLKQRTIEEIPEEFVPLIPPTFPPDYTPFRFPLDYEEPVKQKQKKKKPEKTYKRAFTSNVPDLPFGLFDAPEMQYGTVAKINKEIKKMFDSI